MVNNNGRKYKIISKFRNYTYLALDYHKIDNYQL